MRSISDAVASEGLVRVLIEHPDWAADDEATLVAIAVAVASCDRAMLVDEQVEADLRALAPHRFFRLQHLAIALIPRLEADHRALVRLVELLVRVGGNDLAATWPNRALRDWCAKDRRRSDAILADARAGDPLAIGHLAFALEPFAMIDEAIELSASSDKATRHAAVTALSRMTVADHEAERIIARLAEVALGDPEEDVALSALLGGFDALSRHVERPQEGMRDALEARVSAPTQAVVHACASLLTFHGDVVSEDELAILLRTIREVLPTSAGTIERIDHASAKLAKDGRLDQLADAIRDIIDRTGGKIDLEAFDAFTHRVQEGGPDAVGRTVVAWLRHGGPAARNALNDLVRESHRTASALSIGLNSIPDDPWDQMLLCRRAIGYLFMTPASAVVIPLAVLRHGDPTLANDLLSLLYNPLLLSYGSLGPTFLAEAEAGHPHAEALRELVARKTAMHEAGEAARALVELRPSEAHREVERARWNDEMERSIKAAHASSPLLSLMTTQHLLYGRRSASYVRDLGGGELRKIDVEMGTHSVEMELPLLDILDPVGLRTLLLHLKLGERVA